MNRKRLVANIIMTLGILAIFQGCANKKITEKPEINLFNQKEAVNVAKEYIMNLKQGNLEAANKLYTDELASKNRNSNLGESKINSFIAEDLIESGDGAYALFDVIRSSGVGPQCDLDNIIIKIIKEDSQYKIDEVSAKNKAHIFEKNNDLRMVEDEQSKSKLIVSLSNMPKDVYLKEGKVMLSKEKAMNNAFGRTSLSYTGEKIAITTLGDNSVFISVADIESSKETQGSIVAKSPNADNCEQDLEDMLDKPMAQKIIPIDVMSDIQVQNIVFSQLEEDLILEYTEKSGSRRINIYKINAGEKLDLKLDEKFPKEKYDLDMEEIQDKTVIINVSPRLNASEINKEILGKYKVDLNKVQIIKV